LIFAEFVKNNLAESNYRDELLYVFSLKLIRM
jgi:hypothetical protein